jgi:hypothetical protein
MRVLKKRMFNTTLAGAGRERMRERERERERTMEKEAILYGALDLFSRVTQ